MDLINKMFNARVLNPLPDGGWTLSEEGVPQGNILSPLLCNIYLNKLDQFVENLILRENKGKRANPNPEFLKMARLSREEARLPIQERRKLSRDRLRRAHRAGLRYTLLDEHFVRIKYVRYADDFIIGVRGKKEIARRILQEVSQFLKSDLQLEVNPEKSRIIDTFSDKADFLGMKIFNVPTQNLPYRSSGAKEKLKRNRTRVINRVNRWREERFSRFRDIFMEGLRKKYKRAVDQGALEELKESAAKSAFELIDPEALQQGNREAYRSLIEGLLKVTDVRESQKLTEFLKL